MNYLFVVLQGFEFFESIKLIDLDHIYLLFLFLLSLQNAFFLFHFKTEMK